ncbi:MAG: hypothetical protein HY654_06850 [Acidobacteria bacterium]|nr:hypothetical protein [Acidobacteriota bacterium]
MPVRLFVGNLPFGATEADLRNHFSALAPPVSILMPVNRETGRPRGFAFVDFADRGLAEEAIRRFNGQTFQGRPLAVSEARAREDRPPGGFAPRPPVERHGPPRFGEPPGAPLPPRDRGFGRGEVGRGKAPARRQAKAESGGPKGPIRERHTGRVFDVDDLEAKDEPIEFEDFATRAKDPFAPPDGEEE